MLLFWKTREFPHICDKSGTCLDNPSLTVRNEPVSCKEERRKEFSVIYYAFIPPHRIREQKRIKNAPGSQTALCRLDAVDRPYVRWHKEEGFSVLDRGRGFHEPLQIPFCQKCKKDDPKGLWSLFDVPSLEWVAFGVKGNCACSPDVL